ELTCAEDLGQDASVAEGHLPHRCGYKAMTQVEIRVAFGGREALGTLQSAAGRAELLGDVVKRMAPGVTGRERQTGGIALLQLHIQAIVGRVAVGRLEGDRVPPRDGTSLCLGSDRPRSGAIPV